MKKYRVFSCGKRPVRVEARTPYSAAVKAIQTQRFRKMGYLLKVETIPHWWCDGVVQEGNSRAQAGEGVRGDFADVSGTSYRYNGSLRR